MYVFDGFDVGAELQEQLAIFLVDAELLDVESTEPVEQVLLEYEMVYHKAWLDTIDVVDGGTADDSGQFSLSCRAVQWKCGNPSILKSTLYKIIPNKQI